MYAHLRRQQLICIVLYIEEEIQRDVCTSMHSAVVCAATCTQYRDVSYDAWVELAKEVLVDPFRWSHVTKQVFPPMRG